MEYLRTWYNKALAIIALIFMISSCVRKSDEEFILESALEVSMRIEDSFKREALLGSIANGYATQGQYEKALEITEEIADSSMKDFSYSWISQCLAGEGKFSEALEIARLIGKEGIKSNALSEIVVSFSDNKQYEMARAISDSIMGSFLRTWSLVEIGKRLFENGKREDALIILEKAFDFAKLIEDQEERDNSLDAVSSGFAKMEENERAMAISDMISNDWTRARAYKNIADAYIELGDSAQAQIPLEKAYCLAIKVEDVDDFNRYRFFAGLGTRFFKAGDYEKGIQIIRSIDSDIPKIRSLAWIAFRYAEREKTEEADKLFSEALAIAMEIEEPYYKAIALSSFGKDHAEEGENRKAIDLLNEASDVMLEIGEDHLKRPAMYSISWSYILAGAYERGLEICAKSDPWHQVWLLGILLEHQKESGKKLGRKERQLIKQMVASGKEKEE